MLGKRRTECLEDLTFFVPCVFELKVTIDDIVVELLKPKPKVKSDV